MYRLTVYKLWQNFDIQTVGVDKRQNVQRQEEHTFTALERCGIILLRQTVGDRPSSNMFKTDSPNGS